MFKRGAFKVKGKAAFYRNWVACIIVCFVYLVLVGGSIITFTKDNELNYQTNITDINLNGNGGNNSDIVNDFIVGISINQANDDFSDATRGVIAPIVNNISKSGSFLFGVLNAINQFLFKDRVWAGIIIIVGAFIALLYWIFVSKVLEVGKTRFFLENRKYIKTRASKIILPYKLRKTKHVAYTMFIKNIYTVLWIFTIVGPIIKYYSYLMVPYILAENPNIKTKDVLRLSKEMMNGYKWECFKLDLSFIGWHILGVITFNISNLVFTRPYIDATYAEVYMYLRELAKTRGIKGANLLSDTNLEGDVEFSEYPVYLYGFKDKYFHKWLNINYQRSYSLENLVLLFFIFSIVGWLWEVLFHLFQYGDFVNRGTLHGPWLPIYGSGIFAMLVFLKPFRKKPIVYFLMAMLLSGIIEYGTSVYLEVVHGMEWWDYEGYFLNINGRVCLEGLLMFGIGGMIVTYVAAPLIANLLDKISKKIKIILSIILMCFLVYDFHISGDDPNQGSGVSSEITESNLDKVLK